VSGILSLYGFRISLADSGSSILVRYLKIRSVIESLMQIGIHCLKKYTIFKQRHKIKTKQVWEQDAFNFNWFLIKFFVKFT